MAANWFVGFVVPADWLSATLADRPDQVRAFVEEDLHMTVAFFGAVDAARAKSVIPLMDRVDWPSYQIRLGSLIPLPKPQRFSALSFSLTQGHDQSVAFMETYRDIWLAHVGAPADTRQPLPHITIARPHRKAGVEQRQVILDWAAAKKPPDLLLPIRELALYTWSDDRKTRQFQIVHKLPLGSQSGLSG